MEVEGVDLIINEDPGVLPWTIISRLTPLNQSIHEFFVATLRNSHTRQAYFRATINFMLWLDEQKIGSIERITPVDVANWVETLSSRYAVSTVKQHLAALNMLFDWLVVRQQLEVNPAKSVRSPRLAVRTGKTPSLDAVDVRRLIESIDTANIIGLRDRALIGTMLYSFARIGAALSMRVDDVFVQNRRYWIRLHEKGGKMHAMPCHHELEGWLAEYLAAGGLDAEPRGWLFRSISRQGGRLSEHRLLHANAYAMVKRRASKAGLSRLISNHSFRASGITAYLLNGGTLEQAAKMANHASTRTTQLYDRRQDRFTLSEIEKIRF